jgi:DNA polymerase V
LGIGRKNGKQFQDYKFYSCYDLTFANKHHLGKQFSVMIARTIPELKGQSCTTFNDPVTPAKSILSSRSFATVWTKKSIIKYAVIFHVIRAHKRLNWQQQLCACVHVHAMKRYLAHPIKIGCLMR